ncbi:MAG: malonyl-CoA decarboxylase family protein, partial [Kiloniellales bacterium]|nr:malonyl-CoA decarboxylase family protein [Kiloniellales bacterium]
LQGVSFGEYLIKRVVMTLSEEFANLKAFATLSPLPGFRSWLNKLNEEDLKLSITREEQGGIKALGGSDELAVALQALLKRDDWHEDEVIAEALKEPLRHLAARYLHALRDDGLPLDPVARFHLKNGARLERINWLGDCSERGLKQSAGLMVNYLYDRGDMEKNHEAYVREHKLAVHSDIRTLSKIDRGNSSALRKLRFG